MSRLLVWGCRTRSFRWLAPQRRSRPENKPTETPEKPEAEPENAGEIAVFSPYQWRDWSIVRSRDCLYLWNEFCALGALQCEQRVVLDNKLATMNSSGSTEGDPDPFRGWSLFTVLWCRYNAELGFVTIVKSMM